MASFSSYSLLVSIAFFCLMFGSSFAERHVSLRNICSQIIDSRWCMEFMQTDSRTADANNHDLTGVAIDFAYSVAKGILQDLRSSDDNGNNDNDNGNDDYHVKDGRYSSCAKAYIDAIREIQQTKNLFNDGDYKRVAHQVSDAKSEIRECKNQFQDSSSDSYNLKKRNKEFGLLCEVIKVSAKSLSEDSNN